MSKKVKVFILLNILLMIYSLDGVLSKTAAGETFLSIKFVVCYGGMLFIMFLYAVGWQQVIKHLPLTTAYANKAITVVWGIIWGVLFFNETVTVGKVIGAVIVISGVVLYVIADSEEGKDE